MVHALRLWFAARAEHPYVRPWGLATPVLVLIVCLPLLRPLLRPTEISDSERDRFATIEAIVEHHSLEINRSSFRVPSRYSNQPPVMAALLAGPYWVLHRLGYNFQSNLALTSYLLTLIGSTLPVAGASGLLYRMGRLFELRRPYRTALAMAGVFASGLVSYATVLNSHTPAAFFLLAACGSFLQAGATRRQSYSYWWVGLAGFCVAMASVIDLGAIVFLLLLLSVIAAMRWRAYAKAAGVFWYVFGASWPILLHAMLTIPITGDLRPGFLHGHLLPTSMPAGEIVDPEDISEDIISVPTQMAMHFADGVLGPHGLLSHFPIILIGIGGIGAVLHRHWPSATKALSVVSLMGALLIILAYISLGADWQQPMYCTRWFILFTPLLTFWAGAWLRRQHRPISWIWVCLLLAFSTFTTLLGATYPLVPAKKGQYTVVAVVSALFSK